MATPTPMVINGSMIINGDVAIKYSPQAAPPKWDADSQTCPPSCQTLSSQTAANDKDEGLRQSAQEEKEESSFLCTPPLINRLKEAGKQLGIRISRSSAWISRSPPPQQPMQPSWEDLVDKYDPGPPPRPGTKFDQFNYDKFTLLRDD